MLLKFLLGAFFVSSLLGAFVLAPKHRLSRNDESGNLGADSQVQDGRRLRLMSWNIGNGDLEAETRAHVEDLPAVAQVILDNNADAVALQELTGEDQLKLLLASLKNRYRGYVCSAGNADRVEAVLVKDQAGRNSESRVRFNDVPAGDRFAAAATFRLYKDLPEIVLVSAHADAFSASRRRTFTEDVVDWTRGRTGKEIVFIAGDFNFEVSTRNKTNLFTDDAKHDSESFAYLLKYFRDLGKDAGETSVNDRRIDYIFGAAKTVSLNRAEVLRGAAIGQMDHWPLLAEVAF
jgi:endonuclease/exonuclease/phosphatase family metal-dependent hydrolase